MQSDLITGRFRLKPKCRGFLQSRKRACKRAFSTHIFSTDCSDLQIQSDSVGRKRPFSIGLFFDWIILGLLFIVSRVDFIVVVLFLEAIGVSEYCCRAAETTVVWKLCASCVLREQRMLRARLTLVHAG